MNKKEIDVNLLPKSRAEAKKINSIHYFTGKPCIKGHISKKYTGSSKCHECSIISGRKSKRWLNRTDYMREYSKKYEAENRERINELGRASYQRNKEKERLRSIKKRKNNESYYNMKLAERRAKKKKATVDWIDKKNIPFLYKKAKELGFEVDHIVPITSDIVCGLHCFNNLQLLNRSENAFKSNKLWPDMP